MDKDHSKQTTETGRDAKGEARAKKRKQRKPKTMPDVARLYIEDQAKAKTPMVSVTRDEEFPATVIEYDMYEHLLCVDGEPTPVTKLTLQYH